MRVLLPSLFPRCIACTAALFAACLFVAATLASIAVQGAPGTTARTPAGQQNPSPSAKASSFPVSGIHEEVIGKITPGNDPGPAVSSGGHLAWIEKKENQEDYGLVFLDGKKQFDEYAAIFSLLVSSDGQHCAFVGELPAGQFLILDGQKSPGEYTRVAELRLGSEAGSYTLTACDGEKCRLVVNGKGLGPEYQDIRAPAFTGGREHYLYLAEQNDKWVLVRDGREEGSKWDDSENLRISFDGLHTAFAARLKNKWAWVVDGTSGPGFPVISPLAVSEDGQHSIYVGVIPHGSVSSSVVLDGEIVASFQGVGWVYFNQGVPGIVARYKFHAPYGFFEQRLSQNVGGGWVGLMPGVHTLLAKFDGVSNPLFAGATKAVYAAKRGDKDFAVFVGGTAGPGFEDVSTSIAVSQDGKHIAYAGLRGGSFVEVIDQHPGRSYPQQSTKEMVGNVTLSEDAAHFAYEIVGVGLHERANRRVVVDAQGEPLYDAIEIRDFQFSADGMHHAYLVSGAKGYRDLVVFDGLESPNYDSVVPGSLRFLDSRTVNFVALKNRTYVRVTEGLQ